MELTRKDGRIVRQAIKAGVLEDIEDHRLDQRNGVILVTCADGDHFHDLFTHQVKLQAGQRSDPRIHTMSWNGGALRLAHNSPTNRPLHTTDVDLLEEIADARKLKDINTVALYAHGPCGKARAHKLDAKRVLAHLMNAKIRLKEQNSGVCVACFFHVHWREGKRRSYFVNRAAWEKWNANSPAY